MRAASSGPRGAEPHTSANACASGKLMRVPGSPDPRASKP